MIKKEIILFIIVLLLISCVSNNNKKNNFKETGIKVKQKDVFKPNAVVYHKMIDTIPYFNYQGKRVGIIKNDEDMENFISLKIMRDSLDYFNVEIKMEINDTINRGWLKKAFYIGTYARNYSGNNQQLNLYEKPNINSKVISVIKDYIPNLYIINNIKGDWVHVTVKYENKSYSGWLEPSMQCANSYSYCN